MRPSLPRPTARLFFRELDERDLPALRAILQDPTTMAAYEGPFDEAEVQAWLARQRARYADDGLGLWAVCSGATGETIGQCGLTWQPVDDSQVLEVGYLFQRSFWHRGFATEAARACRDHAFTVLDAPRVHAIIRDNNLASMNVAIRCGMTVRRRVVRHFRGVVMPHYVFAVDRAAGELAGS